MNDVIRVYDARDADCAGAGLGVISPTECEVTEAAGGDYVLTAAIPIADGTGWELALLDRQVVATVPVGAARKRQRFRIHATTVQDGGLTIAIQARHVTYDLSYYVLHQEEETTEKISAREAGEKLWNAIEGGAGAFALHVEMDRQLRISWGRINVIRALLDQTGGFVRKARARLLRDNQDIYLLPSDVLDSGLIIRRDVNLTALSVDRDTTETYTRLIPTGQDANGDVIYLPEKSIDAPEIDEYAMPRVYTWAVSGARVGQERTRDDGTKEALTLEQVYDLLRDAAQEKLDAGVGAPEQSGTVEYIDLSRTEQFATLFRLQDAFLYAQITVENALTGFRLKKQVSGYTWDVLEQRYTQLKLGDPWTDGGKDSFVTSSQHDSAMQALTISQEQFDAMLKRHAVAVEDNKQKTSDVEIKLDAAKAEIDLRTTRLESDLGTQRDKTNAAEVRISAAEAAIEQKASSQTVEGMNQRLSLAEANLDAAQAAIQLKASQNDMDDALRRLNAAEINIDGANVAIELKADKKVTDTLGNRLMEAEASIKAANGAIELKASKTDVDGLATRMSNAEASIDAANAAIDLKVSKDGIINAINLSSNGAVISANRIDLSGYTTMSDFKALSGELDRIKSGTATIDRLRVGTLVADAVSGPKSINADNGWFGAVYVGEAAVAQHTLTIGGTSCQFFAPADATFDLSDMPGYDDALDAARREGASSVHVQALEAYGESYYAATKTVTAALDITLSNRETSQHSMSVDASGAYSAGRSDVTIGEITCVDISAGADTGRVRVTVKISNGKTKQQVFTFA